MRMMCQVASVMDGQFAADRPSLMRSVEDGEFAPFITSTKVSAVNARFEAKWRSRQTMYIGDRFVSMKFELDQERQSAIIKLSEFTQILL